MTANYKYKSIIGRAEPIDIVGNQRVASVSAKIDTGAYSSSIWASSIKEDKGHISFVLFDKTSPHYTGERITMKNFEKVNVENSFAYSEERYGVELTVRFCGKKFRTFFTLADRSKKIYPVLIGRKALKNRFLIDVSLGHPVANEDTEEILGYDGLKRHIKHKAGKL